MQVKVNISYGSGGRSGSYAIIVAGELSGPSRPYKPLVNHGANNAYKALRNLGYDDEHIVYLNSDSMQDIDGDGISEVDCSATSDNFTAAVDRAKANIGDGSLIMYLFGHCTLEAGCGRFILDDEAPEDQRYIADHQLHDLLLDEYSQPLANKMLIVVNSCHSESFIAADTDVGNDSVSADNRIVIATTLKSLSIYVWDGLTWGDAFWHSLMKGNSVKDALVRAAETRGVDALLDDNADGIGHDESNLAQEGSLAQNTTLGNVGSERLELTSSLWFWKKNAGEMRVYDGQGNVAGRVNGEIHEDIPGSAYYADYDVVVILDPGAADGYVCQVVGTAEGAYEVDITFGPGDNAGVFSATRIPLRLGATHQYTVAWDVLSQAGKGATASMDSDGDSVFEQTISSGEVLAAPVADVGGPYFSDEGSLVHLDASGSYDSDGTIVSFDWDFDGDGVWDASSAVPTADRAWEASYAGNLTLRVTDDNGFTGVDTTAVRVGLRRILLCDSGGDAREQYAPSQSVYVKGIGFEPNTAYAIWIQDNAISDGDGMSDAEDPSGGEEQVTTNANGDFGPTEIWCMPSGAGISRRTCSVVVDKQDEGDNTGCYNSSSDGAATFVVGDCADPATLVIAGLGLAILGGLAVLARRKPPVAWP